METSLVASLLVFSRHVDISLRRDPLRKGIKSSLDSGSTTSFSSLGGDQVPSLSIRTSCIDYAEGFNSGEDEVDVPLALESSLAE